MHNIISVIIVILIVIIFIKAVGKSNQIQKKRRVISSSTHKPSILTDNVIYDMGCGKRASCPDDLHAAVAGLHEVELNTRTRGYVPHANQPNHVANLWKCDQSHCDQEDMTDRNEYNSEANVVRGAVVNMSNDDASNMHLTSRFGGVKSD